MLQQLSPFQSRSLLHSLRSRCHGITSLDRCRNKLGSFTERGEFLPLKVPSGGQEGAGEAGGHSLHTLLGGAEFSDTWGGTTSNTSAQPNFFPSLGQGIWGPAAVLTGILSL